MVKIELNDILFSFDKSYYISYNSKYICCLGKKINVYDARTGQHINCFDDVDNPYFSHFIDENTLVVKSSSGEYFLYDLSAKCLCNTIYACTNEFGSILDFCISIDGKYIVDAVDYKSINELITTDTETGEFSKTEIGSGVISKIFDSGDSTNYYLVVNNNVYVNEKNINEVSLLSVNIINQRISRLPFSIHNFRLANCDYCNGKCCMIGNGNEIVLYDIVNNSSVSFTYEHDAAVYSVFWSEDGRYIIITESDSVKVLDVSSHEIVKRYDVDYGCFAKMIDNNRKMLIGTWNNGYCIRTNLP